MPTAGLRDIPAGTDVFIDANILVYGIGGRSAECRQFLERCSREELTGISLIETVNEATHRFMLAEALSKGLISKGAARALREKFQSIPSLTDYWRETERVLSLNLLFISLEESMIRVAQMERQEAGLLTNDSMIVACMREFGVFSLATRDRDFERVRNIEVFSPTDIP